MATLKRFSSPWQPENIKILHSNSEQFIILYGKPVKVLLLNITIFGESDQIIILQSNSDQIIKLNGNPEKIIRVSKLFL